MTINSVYYKEREGIVQNPIGHLSPASTPWWSGPGTQLPYVESLGQLKSLSLEHSSSGDQLTSTKHAERGIEQGLEKGITSQFTIFTGNFLFARTYAILLISDSWIQYIEPWMGLILVFFPITEKTRV